jgi:ribosome-associated toxin RatA of RatAB toxin-antitoxin module
MNKFGIEAVGSAPQMGIFDTILGVEAFPEFIPWVQSARIDRKAEGSLGRWEMEASVLLSLRSFSGWVSARIDASREDGRIFVRMTKGPFQLAEVTLQLKETAATGQTLIIADVRYATPLAIYRSLVEKHKVRIFSQLVELLARRQTTRTA